LVRSLSDAVSHSILECKRKTIKSHKAEIDPILKVAAAVEELVRVRWCIDP